MPPIVIVGVHPVREALRAGGVREVRVGARADARVNEIVRLAEASGVPVRRVDVEELDRLAGGERHQGVLATLADAPRRWTLEQLVAIEPRPLIVVLDGVEDPHNVGAILRTADAVGATAVVRQERHAAALGPAAARASAGAMAHVRIVDVVNVARAIETLKSLGVWVVGLDCRGRAAVRPHRFPAADGAGGRRGGRGVATAGPGALRLHRGPAHARAREQPERLGGDGGRAVRGAAAALWAPESRWRGFARRSRARLTGCRERAYPCRIGWHRWWVRAGRVLSRLRSVCYTFLLCPAGVAQSGRAADL